jgi:hypothetical protein
VVSADVPPQRRETEEQHIESENANAARATCRQQELDAATTGAGHHACNVVQGVGNQPAGIVGKGVLAPAAQAAPQQQQNRNEPRQNRLRARDLLKDFEQDGHEVYNSPQSNLGTTLAALGQLEDTPAIWRLQAHIRIATTQVEERGPRYSKSFSNSYSRSRSDRPHHQRHNNAPLEPIAEEGGGENEVAQPVNPTANVTANQAANPTTNAAGNAHGNAQNNAANAAGAQQQNVATNARQNARAQSPPVQANHAQSSQHRRIRDEVEIARRANYDSDNRVPDPLDANNHVQATEPRQMHDQELLRRAQYDQDNGPPDDLYIILMAYAPSASPGVVNNFSAFSRRLGTIRYPKDFKPTIEKYDGRSDPSIWLKMYNIMARASGGNEDHMAGFFPLVMGNAPLQWLDNLPAECITSWATLSRLFMTNYQAIYNRSGNTHHFARVRMRRDETLRE